MALSNARLANRNALAIKRLKFNEWGSIQSRTSTQLSESTFTADHPICFHVNNLNSGSYGPQLWRPNAYGEPNTISGGHFSNFMGVGNAEGDMNDLETQMLVNGPKFKLLYATFDFEFHGFLDATNVRVDFIRQKKIDHDFYHASHGEANFLPHALGAFRQLAGFTPNRIDQTKFQILATRKLYFNSKGSSNLADQTQDRNTTDATTAPIKHARVCLKLRKIFKQLRNTTDQASGVQSNVDPFQEQSGHDASAGMGFDNFHPLSNIWCILSTDDQTAFASFATGDSVKLKIIRKVTWQDHVG